MTVQQLYPYNVWTLSAFVCACSLGDRSVIGTPLTEAYTRTLVLCFISKLARECFHWLPITAQAGFSQLIKGGGLMLLQNALQAARIHELEEQ